MSDSDRIVRARAHSAEAKQQLRDTLTALRRRLDPQKVAKDAVEGLLDKGARALRSGVETAKRNPAPLIGAAALLAAFFNRKRLGALISRKRAPKSTKPAAAKRVRSTKSRRTPPKRISK